MKTINELLDHLKGNLYGISAFCEDPQTVKKMADYLATEIEKFQAEQKQVKDD